MSEGYTSRRPISTARLTLAALVLALAPGCSARELLGIEDPLEGFSKPTQALGTVGVGVGLAAGIPIGLGAGLVSVPLLGAEGGVFAAVVTAGLGAYGGRVLVAAPGVVLEKVLGFPIAILRRIQQRRRPPKPTPGSRAPARRAPAGWQQVNGRLQPPQRPAPRRVRRPPALRLRAGAGAGGVPPLPLPEPPRDWEGGPLPLERRLLELEED